MTAAPLLDTHCHVDGYTDPVEVLGEAGAAGVDVVAVTEDPGRYRTLRTRLGRRAGVKVALGLHPLRVGPAAMADVARFLRLLPQAEWVGEVGLDSSRAGAATVRQQLRVFETLLAERQVTRRPMTVHSRGAEREVVTRLLQIRAPAILHWYTGPLSVADDALAGGLRFSINPAMTVSRRSASLLALLPPDRVLLETDGPFARWSGRPSRPPDLHQVTKYLARLWKLTPEQAQETIVNNQRRLAEDVTGHVE